MAWKKSVAAYLVVVGTRKECLVDGVAQHVDLARAGRSIPLAT